MPQIIIVVSVILLDQVTKYLTRVFIRPIETFPLWEGVFHFTYAENRGAAFSILQNQRWLFIVFSILFVIFASYYLATHRKDSIILKTGLSMIMGGAIGNLIDRIGFGYVTDFLDFRAINFAIFNIADSAVVVGSILLGYYLLFIYDKENKAAV